MTTIEVGTRGTATLVVTAADTAVAMGSGSVDVLATPRVVALCEQATCAALAAHQPEGWSSVGVRVELDHVRATPVGRAVSAEAVLAEVDGRRLMFTVTATDDKGPIAAGRVTRATVEVQRFMEKAQ